MSAIEQQQAAVRLCLEDDRLATRLRGTCYCRHPFLVRVLLLPVDEVNRNAAPTPLKAVFLGLKDGIKIAVDRSRVAHHLAVAEPPLELRRVGLGPIRTEPHRPLAAEHVAQVVRVLVGDGDQVVDEEPALGLAGATPPLRRHVQALQRLAR